jgi:uncharacterized protein YbjT (DUF2867 family)
MTEPNLAMESVLVVGASGKLGTATTRLLLAEGYPVRAMTRFPKKAAHLADMGAHLFEGDLRDLDSLRRACEGVDYVIAAAHAALEKGANCPKTVDGKGHRDLIDVARAAGIRHFSYTSAANISVDHPVDFFRIKFATEEYLKASGLDYSIIRGPAFMETQHEVLGGMILKKKKAFLFGRGEGRGNFVSVVDMARFLVWSFQDERLHNRLINVGGPDNFTQNQLVDIYESVCGFPVKRSYVPVHLLKALKILVGTFHPVARRICTMGILIATSDSSIDPGELLDGFSWRPRSYKESVRDWLDTENPG